MTKPMLPLTALAVAVLFAIACMAKASSSDTTAGRANAERNARAIEADCPVNSASPRSGGLVDIAPDGTGTTARERECIVLSGERRAAQVGRTIEVSDAARGPVSGPGISTADSGSYALSLVNVRPGWPASSLTGEADGMSVFVRQASGDTAAYLANVGVRAGYAATLESYTFAADPAGRPLRAVRTQLGVVNPRDGGEYGLVLQASEGDQLAAGLRIASLGTSTWKNYFEAISPTGESVASIRGSDGAIVGGDLLPTADLRKTVGSPDARYTATYTQVVQLAAAPLASLPQCNGGAGAGTMAFVADAQNNATGWGQVVSGGGKYRVFAKCDGSRWTTF